MRVGLHLSTAGGVHKAALEAELLGIDCLQIFAGSPRMWKRTEIKPAHAELFKEVSVRVGLRPVVIHAPYLINLAAADEALWQKSVDTLDEQLDKAAMLGALGVVVHPGSRGTRPLEWGLERVCRAVERLHGPGNGRPMVLLENTAGGGGHLGGALEEQGRMLAELSGLPCGVCLDTAHAWAAGYAIDSPRGVAAYLGEVDRLIGLNNIKVWHFNDIDLPCGQRRDVHTHLGRGRVGRAGFGALTADERMKNAAVIMETPKPSRWADRRNVLWLRKTIAESTASARLTPGAQRANFR